MPRVDTHPAVLPDPAASSTTSSCSPPAPAPLAGFNEPGSPVTLDLPAEVVDAAHGSGEVELVDPEGLPLAAWSTSTAGCGR